MNLGPSGLGCPSCGVVFRQGYLRCPNDGVELIDIADDPLLGRTLKNQYVIEAFVGEGGHGRVYRARHVRLERRFAIKVLYGDLAANGNARARFTREAETAALLNHPNLVPVLDAELEGALCYLVMEYVGGPTLEDRLEREGRWPEVKTIQLIEQLAAGLEHAHALGLVHRDLKPENLLYPSPDSDLVRITDFGIAFIESSVPRQGLTSPGTLLGTPGYMAPEQVTGTAVDGRADLYALGMLGYRTLMGRHPGGATDTQRLTSTMGSNIPDLAESGIEAPILGPVLARMVAWSPEERPSSAQEVLTMLAGPTADAWPDEIAELVLEERPQRGRWWVGAASLVGITLLAGTVWLASSGALEPSREVPPTAPRAESASSDTVEVASPKAELPKALPKTPAPPEQEAAEPASVKPLPSPAPAPAKTRRRRSRPTPPVAPADTAASRARRTPAVPTIAELQAVYAATAQDLERVEALGLEEAAPLRERYFALSLPQAMADEDVRQATVASLKRISSAARRAAARARPR